MKLSYKAIFSHIININTPFSVFFAVRFSNGFTSNAEELDFATFKNIEENNPRKKIRRIVVRNCACVLAHTIVCMELIYFKQSI